jgi:putative flippase GtrA
VRIDFRRWGVFNLVGFGGFILQIGTIALLTRVLGWPSVFAAAAGLEIAAFHNFIGHNWFTWNERPPSSIREWVRRYLRFQVTKTASLAASLAITVAVIAATGLPAEIANTIAVALCALPNYLLTEFLVFRSSKLSEL